VTVPNVTATYGDPSVTLTAIVDRPDGGNLNGGTVTFVVKQGATVRATLVSGPVNSLAPVTVSVTLSLDATWTARNYTIVATYNGGGPGTPVTCTGTLTITRPILWLKPTDRTVGLKQPNPPTTPPAGCLARATATSACWLELADGSTFAYGQSWSALDVSFLRFQYARNPPSTNATEHVGSTYRVTAFGVNAANYDLRYLPGTLTVVAP